MEHDEKRRAFLVGAGVAAGSGLLGVVDASRASAQDAKHDHAATSHGPAVGYGAFFNEDDAATIAAFAERLMPGTADKPGASDCGVLNYIDQALSGAYADQQDFYRRGLEAVGAYSIKAFGQPFVKLAAKQQDEVIAALEAGKATEFTWPTAQAFFVTLRTHTMEGMFGDPLYGGNRNFAGWRLIGFPGTQPYYDEADLASRGPFTRAAITGLQGQAAQSNGSTRKG